MLTKTSPAFKDYLWGGDKLKKIYNKQTDKQIVAESWELSAHKDGLCRLDDRRTLDEIFLQNKELFGTNIQKFERFPMLIKIIDAKQNLSVQVHPSDEYALYVEKEYGKAEVWYILEAEEGAGIYCGFKNDLTKEEFASAISDGTLEEKLNFIKVKPFESYFIDAGTVHAIGKGLTLLEIQQNSNTTYRVFDYNRRDANNNLRELHVEKAKDVSNLNKFEKKRSSVHLISNSDYQIKRFADCKYFTCEEIDIKKELSLYADKTSFHALCIISNDCKIESCEKSINAKKYDTLFISANTNYSIKGDTKIVLSYVK